MLLAFVSVFAACSDDDYNTNGDTTVSFAKATLTTKESAGLIEIPVNVEGARNGDVSFVVKAEEVGDSPAKEDENYYITSKKINLKADTLTSNSVNVELNIVDDDVLNDDRTFKLTIASVNGGKVGENSSILITIRDNESSYFEQFFGTWTVTGMQYHGQAQDGTMQPDTEFSSDITISGPIDETNANYDKLLTAKATNFFDIGADISFEWHFNYTLDRATGNGTIGFVCGEQVASYGSQYQWVFLTDNGQQMTEDPITAEWSLTGERKIPTEITFPEDQMLWFYQPGAGWWAALHKIKMVKK